MHKVYRSETAFAEGMRLIYTPEHVLSRVLKTNPHPDGSSYAICQSNRFILTKEEPSLAR
jgi:hypothetical protein